MDTLPFLITCAALALGTVAQRTVGMGFGLVVTPTLVLVVGPLEAVLVMNVFGTVACGIMVPRVWRDIDWRRLALMCVPAVAFVIPGILIASVASLDLLKIVIGGLAIAGVALSAGVLTSARPLTGGATFASLGAATGLLTGGVGLGAPAIAVLNLLSRWDHRSFTATMQPFWLVLSGVTVATRLIFAPEGTPSWPWWAWVIAAVPLLVGAAVGDRIASRIDAVLARRLIIAFSLVAGVTVLIVGVIGLIG